MATFYVRSSHESVSSQAHFPFPGTRYEAATAAEAAQQHLNAVSVPNGSRLVVTTIEGWFVAQPAALPLPEPTYT